MKNSKLNSVCNALTAATAVCLVVYNTVLFAVCGFTGHSAAFWISYAFMLLALVTLSLSVFFLRGKATQPKDWLFGLPILRHCAIYIITETVVSLLFMALCFLNCPWWLAFSVQLIAWAIHMVFIFSCFMARETVSQLQTKIADATSFIRLLQADAELAAAKASDPAVKSALEKLAEQIRFSDPMSNQNLFELEKEITLEVNRADECVSSNDCAGALSHCQKAALLLSERNKKCKALK